MIICQRWHRVLQSRKIMLHPISYIPRHKASLVSHLDQIPSEVSWMALIHSFQRCQPAVSHEANSSLLELWHLYTLDSEFATLLQHRRPLRYHNQKQKSLQCIQEWPSNSFASHETDYKYHYLKADWLSSISVYSAGTSSISQACEEAACKLETLSDSACLGHALKVFHN